MENPRIQSLHIKNYRLFKNFEMEGLGWVNLISGKNNTGKTVLLEAIRILESEGDNGVINDILKRRNEWDVDFEDNYLSMIYDRKLTLFNNEITINRIGLEFLEQNGHFQGNVEVFRKMDAAEGQNKQKLHRLDRRNYSPKDKAQYISTWANEERTFKLWKKIDLTPKEDEVRNALNLLNQNVERVSVYENSAKVRLKNLERPISIKSMGEGMSRVLNIAIAMVTADELNPKSPVLLIDEFENGLHHSVQTKLWEFVFEMSRRHKVQVFATTHSRDCIEAFQEVSSREEFEDRKGKYFRLEKKKEDIKAVPFSAEQLDFATSENLEIR